MAVYMSGVAISGFYYAVTNPMDIVCWIDIVIKKILFYQYQQDEVTPIHELGIGFAGLIVATVVGSFLVYHLYLISYVTIFLLSSEPTLLAGSTGRRSKTCLRFYSYV